jgi:surface protein
MFYHCPSLTSLDVSHFNTEKVTNMFQLFRGCESLTSLDVSHFNTVNVTNMISLFSNCSGLTSLDLSSFNTKNVTNMAGMFYYCTDLTTIYVGSNWSTEAVTRSVSMFFNCPNLVGGMGTTYDYDHTDAEYAHIDGGPSDPGYFSAKPLGPRGDVNGDGKVSIADVTDLIDFLLTGNW